MILALIHNNIPSPFLRLLFPLLQILGYCSPLLQMLDSSAATYLPGCSLAQEAICCYCNFCHYSFYCRPTFCWIATFAITFPTYSTLFTYSIANCLLFAGLPARARRVQAPWAVRRPFRRQPAVIGHILHCRL